MTGLVLREPELRLVLSAYADDVLLVVQDPGDLVRVEACQAIYSAASSARVNWVKNSGLAVGDWRQIKLVEIGWQEWREWLGLGQNTRGVKLAENHPSRTTSVHTPSIAQLEWKIIPIVFNCEIESEL
ncbi:unnamed protein product [Caretta caretta]